jgi:hypothetical protein
MTAPKAFHFPQAEIRSISATVDRGLRFSVVTGEIPDDSRGAFLKLQGINSELLISPHEREEGDEPVVVDSDVKRKSPSERLRAVLYVFFQQRKKAGKFTGNFQAFYEEQIDVLIERCKSKLDPD